MTKQKTMIVNKNDEKRLITSAVLIPDYEDCDAPRGEKTLSCDEIEDFAHKYMERYRISDKNHDYFQSKEEVATPVESWILKEATSLKTLDNEEITYPVGTWFTTMKVHDDNVWAGVQDGTYNGLSVTVTPESVADQLIAGKSRVLIKDVPDPVAATIAIVDKPCVHGAKFCSVKSANKSSKDDSYESKRDKIQAALRKQYEKAYIELTFDDKVIFHEWEEDAYYEIPYSINVEDNVELGTAVEVEKEFVAKKMLEEAKKESAIKAGRSISNSTFKKLKNAMDSLGKLIDKANTERDETQEVTKSDKMTNEDKTTNEYVKKEDFESFKSEIKEDVTKAVKEALETDEDKRNNKIASVKSELEELGVDTSKIDFSQKSNEDDEEDSSDENHTDETVEGASKSLDNHEIEESVSTKSTSERIMDSMNKTKKMLNGD